MAPLVFEPYFRPQIWGGRRLETALGKALPPTGSFGEAWEISAHPHHVSVVADGPHRGEPLTQLAEQHARDLYGPDVPVPAQFPLLVKYLDCHELLSIQVHPNDETARQLTGGRELGKTEAWVVMAVEPSGRIYAGLKPGVERSSLEQHLEAGTLADCLHDFTPKVGDCVFLRAGTVHAVGGGVVLAEVQQSSDATFRLFDWNRLGPDGKPRPLHRAESLASIDWSAGPVYPSVGQPIRDLTTGAIGERLATCPYFSLERYRIHGEWPVPRRRRLSVWLMLDGVGDLVCEATGYRRRFARGETVLLAATTPNLRWLPASAGGAPFVAVAAWLP